MKIWFLILLLFTLKGTYALAQEGVIKSITTPIEATEDLVPSIAPLIVDALLQDTGLYQIPRSFTYCLGNVRLTSERKAALYQFINAFGTPINAQDYFLVYKDSTLADSVYRAFKDCQSKSDIVNIANALYKTQVGVTSSSAKDYNGNAYWQPKLLTANLFRFKTDDNNFNGGMRLYRKNANLTDAKDIVNNNYQLNGYLGYHSNNLEIILGTFRFQFGSGLLTSGSPVALLNPNKIIAGYTGISTLANNGAIASYIKNRNRYTVLASNVPNFRFTGLRSSILSTQISGSVNRKSKNQRLEYGFMLAHFANNTDIFANRFYTATLLSFAISYTGINWQFTSESAFRNRGGAASVAKLSWQPIQKLKLSANYRFNASNVKTPASQFYFSDVISNTDGFGISSVYLFNRQLSLSTGADLGVSKTLKTKLATSIRLLLGINYATVNSDFSNLIIYTDPLDITLFDITSSLPTVLTSQKTMSFNIYNTYTAYKNHNPIKLKLVVNRLNQTNTVVRLLTQKKWKLPTKLNFIVGQETFFVKKPGSGILNTEAINNMVPNYFYVAQSAIRPFMVVQYKSTKNFNAGAEIAYLQHINPIYGATLFATAFVGYSY